jgi:NADH dehydrogenase FAD-containing subunit
MATARSLAALDAERPLLVDGVYTAVYVLVFALALPVGAAMTLAGGGGARLQCDAPLVATAGVAPAWLAGSGLALDAQGFIATGATLQSISHPEVFAAGDVASRQDRSLPRDGVQAVRAGLALALDLRRCAAGGVLALHRPPAATLALVSLGEKHAIACRGGFVAAGRWAWWWKDRIDRAWVARFAPR